MDIYNRLINSINNTIKKTYDKSPLIIINNNNNINNSHIFNNEIGKIIQNYNNNSKEKNYKNLLLSDNDMNYFFNSEKNLKINKKVRGKKDLLNIELDMTTTIPYDKKNRLTNVKNISLNNINNKISSINSKPSLREQNIKKINDRRKYNKAISDLSEVSYVFNSNKKKPPINYEIRKSRIKTKNNSLNYNTRHINDKTFYNPYIPNKMNTSKENNCNSLYKFNFNGNNSMISMNTNNYNLQTDTNFIKIKTEYEYDKSFYQNPNENIKSSIVNNKSQILNLSNIKNNKFQSFSFINKNRYNSKNKNSSNCKFLLNSNNKKEGEILKTSGNCHQHSISNKIKKNYKNLIKNNFNNTSGFLNDNENDNSHLKSNLNEQMILQMQEDRNKFKDKLRSLTKLTYCFYRELNNELNKYNPLFDMPSDIICQAPYNFKNASISLTRKFDKLRITPFGSNKIDFNIMDIENTMVNSKIKLIIEIHRNYRKYKESSQNKSIEDFAQQQIKKYPQFTEEEIEKCAKNKNFNFSVIISGGIVIELIICSYQEFKVWINGLAFLVKNKKEIIQSLQENDII